MQQSKAILHPAILAGAKDEDERQAIRGFLLGLTGVQLLDSKAICKEALLPKILTTAPKPSASDLVKYTSYCQQILGEDIPSGSEFWMLTEQGDVKTAKETLLPKEFHPEEDWETLQQYVAGISFVSSDYLAGTTDIDQPKEWRQFFKRGGVKEAPDNGVQVFAEHYAMEKLGATCISIIPVDKLNFGYDLEAEAKTGEMMRVEVKGQSHDQDVELKGNELDAAGTHKDSFYLCVVSSIPENPKMYIVKNPAAKGIKDKVTIPIDIWKTSLYP